MDLWGVTSEEAIGKSFFDLHYPDELAARLQRQIEEVYTTGHLLRPRYWVCPTSTVEHSLDVLVVRQCEPDGSETPHLEA